MCRIAQTLGGRTGTIVMRHRRCARGAWTMLLILAVFVTVIVVVVISRLRVPGGVNAADLGSVSDRWLAEYRGSHPS